MSDQLMSKMLVQEHNFITNKRGVTVYLIYGVIKSAIKTMDHVQPLANNPEVIQLILQSLIDLFSSFGNKMPPIPSPISSEIIKKPHCFCL